VRRNFTSRAGDFTTFMGIGDLTSRRLERRWAPRYDFRVSLDIEWGSVVLRATTRDVSTNGMFIESIDPLWVGAGFTANLQLEQPVKVTCFVKRVEPGRGMGVSVSLPDGQRESYQQLISRLSQTQP
jgi:PilZ domain